MAQDPLRSCCTTLICSGRSSCSASAKAKEPAAAADRPGLVLEFATIEGARCTHLDHKTGSLTPGKQADLHSPAHRQLSRPGRSNNAVGAVVNADEPGHVEHRDDRWQDEEMARGKMIGVDTARVLRLAEEARAGVLQRCGFKRDLLE